MVVCYFRVCSGGVKEELVSGWFFWYEYLFFFGCLVYYLVMEMIVYFLDDIFIIVKEFVKGFEVGGLKGNFGKKIFV